MTVLDDEVLQNNNKLGDLCFVDLELPFVIILTGILTDQPLSFICLKRVAYLLPP